MFLIGIMVPGVSYTIQWYMVFLHNTMVHGIYTRYNGTWYLYTIHWRVMIFTWCNISLFYHPKGIKAEVSKVPKRSNKTVDMKRKNNGINK